MKILVLSEFEKYGGTRTYLLRLLKYFHNRGDEVMLGSVYFDYEIDILLKKYNFNKRKLANPINIFTKIVNIFAPFASGYWSIRSVINEFRPDIICVSVGTPGKYLGATCFSRKVIYMMHTSPTYPLFTKRFAFLEKLIQKLFFKQLKVVAMSEHSQKTIKHHWHLNPEILSTIQHYIDVVKNTSTKPEKDMVLTIGQVEWYKNPNYFIKIAKLVNKKIEKGVRFVWLGDGKLLANMRDKVESNRCIEFRGYTKNTDRWYKKATIYFQPSIVESFGISVGEAMGWGIPCVVSSAGGLPELIDNNFDLVHKKRVVEEICHLIEDRKYWQGCSEKVKERIHENYSYPEWKNKMDILMDQNYD